MPLCPLETFRLEQGQSQLKQVDGEDRVRLLTFSSCMRRDRTLTRESTVIIPFPSRSLSPFVDEPFRSTRVDLLKLIEETVEGVSLLLLPTTGSSLPL